MTDQAPERIVAAVHMNDENTHHQEHLEPIGAMFPRTEYVRDDVYEAVKTERDALREALAFYADPDTYCAIVVLGDPPCGEFAYDISDADHPEYENAYGAKARAALQVKS